MKKNDGGICKFNYFILLGAFFIVKNYFPLSCSRQEFGMSVFATFSLNRTDCE